MGINLNIGQENIFLNVHRINQSLSKNEVEAKNSVQSELKSTVFISPIGKKSSMIESLMKQKQNIMEQKEQLKNNILEQGGTLDSIKKQLESYDEQLKNIDQEIVKTMTEQSKKQTEEMKKSTYDKPKTKEEVENERLVNLTSISSALKQAEIISSVKQKVNGESRILKAEIKTGNGNIESKKVRVTELDQQSVNLNSQIGEKLAEVTENIKENNKSRIVAPDDADKNENKLSQKDNYKFQEKVEENK